MEQEYAQALWRLADGGMAPSRAVAAIQKALESHGRSALLPRVKRAFMRLAERESKKNDLILTIARASDERAAHVAAKKALERAGIKDVDLKTQVDDTIVGGWRLEGRGVLIDMSYKSQLLSIYQRVVNA